MSFAEKYFSRVNSFESSINIDIRKDLEISVIIPVYNEPYVFRTLESLMLNKFNNFSVEIIFVINSSTDSSENILNQNKKSIVELNKYFSRNNNSKLKLLIIDAKNLSSKTAGAGLARKIGMDEALRRFNKLNKPNGIIVSLDADTLVEENYLQSIFNFYSENPKKCAANINFKHPIKGKEFSKEIYDAIIIYEIYLRYYIQALRFSGFPHSFHTIGSAFTVKAETYAKHGGMVVNKSGEDFYFLQKIIPSCNFGVIKNTSVFPSPRITDRVIFGTGIAVKQIIENYNFDFPTYRFESFLILKEFFEQIHLLYNEKNINQLNLNKILKDYLFEIKIELKIKEIIKNTKNSENFKKRFFAWFNALKVLKFLNYIHTKHFEKNSVIIESKKLLLKYYKQTPDNNTELLNCYRKLNNC